MVWFAPSGIVWGQSAKALTGLIFTLKKKGEGVKYMAWLKEPKLHRDSSRQVKILTLFSLYIQETIVQKKSVTAQSSYHMR